MRLILSYPSWASALHTYHYLAMIYCVWSPRSFFMSLQPAIITSQSSSPSSPTDSQTDTQCLDNNWHSLVNCEPRWSVVTCTSYILFEYTITNTLILLIRLSTAGPGQGGYQTSHNENLHISPFWVITVFMYFCDKKFYGCRHHLVQLVLSVNSHNHFPSRLYLRSSCQVSALFSSQEFSVTWLVDWKGEERCHNNPSHQCRLSVLRIIFKLGEERRGEWGSICFTQGHPLPPPPSPQPLIVACWGVKISGEPVNGPIRYKQDILLLSSTAPTPHHSHFPIWCLFTKWRLNCPLMVHNIRELG